MKPASQGYVICFCDACGSGGKSIPRTTRSSHQQSQSSRQLYAQAAELNLARRMSNKEDTPESLAVEGPDFQQVLEAVVELQSIQRSINDDMPLDALGPLSIAFKSDNPETLQGERPPLDLTVPDSQTFHNQRSSLLRHIEHLEGFDTLENDHIQGIRTETQRLAQECLDSYADFESHAWETNLARAALQRDLEKKFSLIGDTGEICKSTMGPSPRGNIIHVSCLFLVTILCILCGLDDGGASFVLECLKVIVTTTFIYANTPPKLTENVLRHFPKTATAGIRLFGLDPQFQFIMICPDCSTRYPPYDPDNPATHINTCSSCDADGKLCGATLLCTISRGDKSYTRPIKRYPLQSVATWICRMMSLPDFEALVDRPLPKDGSEGKWDVWNSDYMSSFRGPDNNLFMNTAGSLLFAMAVDWLNPMGNMEAKKKFSIGAIYIICLNLPLATRFLLENVCIVGIIPGPKETRMDHVHHFFQPIIAEFNALWNPGLWVKSTRRFPLGRLIRAALGPFIGDLPAVKKCLGFTSHSSTYFCHYCKATNDWMDVFDTAHWDTLKRTHEDHRQTLSRLAAATTTAERDAITASTGVRMAETNHLPYFDPVQHAAIDQLHLWMSIIRQLLREVWGMSDSLPSSIPGDPVPSWLENTQAELQKAERMMLTAPQKRLDKLKKPIVQELCYRRGLNWHRTVGQMIRDLEAWRRDRSIVDADGVVRDPRGVNIPLVFPVRQTEAPKKNDPKVQDALLARYLQSVNVEPAWLDRLLLPTLVRACKARDLISRGKKVELIAALIDHHREQRQSSVTSDAIMSDAATTDAESETGDLEADIDGEILLPLATFAIIGNDIMEVVRDDITRTTFPSWMKRTPKRIGSISFGKLSSEEWKSTLLVSLPITLTRRWGLEGGKRAQYLENMVHLLLAIRLANRRLITDHALDLYERHYRAFVEGFVVLYPWERVRPYQHVGLHLPPELRLWGPGDNCNANPPELYNEMLQNIKSNNRFAELEVTAARDFAVASYLKALFAYNALPESLSPFEVAITSFLSKKYQGGLARSVPSSHFDPTRKDWVIETAQKHPQIIKTPDYSALAEELGCEPPLKRAVLWCTGVSISHIRYQVLHVSKHNSRVLYRIRNGSLHCGIIQEIFAESPQKDSTGTTQAQRIFLTLKRFTPLQESDAAKDPYGNHPLLGRNAYDICRMYYDSCTSRDVVAVHDIVSHISTCRYDGDEVFSQATIITVVLDRDYVGSQNPASSIFPSFVPRAKIAPVAYDSQGIPLPVATPTPTPTPTPVPIPAPLPNPLQAGDMEYSGSAETQSDQSTPRASPAPDRQFVTGSESAIAHDKSRGSGASSSSSRSFIIPLPQEPVVGGGEGSSASGSVHYQPHGPAAGTGSWALAAGPSSFGSNINPDAHAQAYGHGHHVGRQRSARLLQAAAAARTRRMQPYPSQKPKAP